MPIALPKYIDDQIIKLYISGKSCHQIAHLLGIARTTATRHIKREGITLRKQYIGEYQNKEWLYQKIAGEHLTPKEIATLCNVHLLTIYRNLKKHGIKAKKHLSEEHKIKISPLGHHHTEETKQKIRLAQLGEKGHNWKGGPNSGRTGSTWNRIKALALARDNFRCRRCGKKENKQATRRLCIEVHHIMPFRCFRDKSHAHDLDNLISYCRSCHHVEDSKKTLIGISVGKGCKIWNYTNMYGCELGDYVSVGAFCEIQRGVKVGNNVKIEAFSYIPEGYTIGDNVFIGPHFCGTNDKWPPGGREHWLPTLIKNGASIGAGVTIVCGVTIGKKAMIGAGSVVTKDIPDGMLAYGNPAKVIRRINEDTDCRRHPSEHNKDCPSL